MNTITQITEHPRKAGRYVVDVDGKQFAIVTADALAAAKARIGVVVDDRLAAHLNEANELTAAYDLAELDLLKTLDSEAVEQVAEEDGLSDAESIERIARKKWKTLDGLDEPTRRRRLFGFLARRGFDSDDVSRVVRQLAGEASNADE